LSDVLDRLPKRLRFNARRASGGPKLERFGEVVEQTAASVKLKVKRDRVIAVASAARRAAGERHRHFREVPIEYRPADIRTR
jgi:hypothetical protein